MLGSENHYFKQAPELLYRGRFDLKDILRIKGYSLDQMEIYVKAFNYFCLNPDDFDGATLVKDLCDLPGLDADAMLHDFHYLKYNVGASINLKTKADWLYAKGNERKGKGLYPAYSRFIGLTITTLGFSLFARIKRGKLTKEQRDSFLFEYKTLLNIYK